PSVRSFARTALPWSNGAAAHHSLFPGSPASANSLRAGAAPPARILSPGNPPHQAPALRPPFSPCPAPKLSALELRSPARASSAETKVHPARATLHPAAPGPAVREEALLAPLRQNPLPRSDTWLPAPFAARISRQVRHPRSKWSSSFAFPACLFSRLLHRQRDAEPRDASIPCGTLPIQLAAKLRDAPRHNRQTQSCPLRLGREKGLENLFAQRCFVRQDACYLFHGCPRVATANGAASSHSRPAELQQLIQLRRQPPNFLQHHLRFAANRSRQPRILQLHLQDRFHRPKRVLQV